MANESRDFREWEGFAKKIASRYVTSGVDQEDLEHEALLALLEEIPRYNIDMGVSMKVFLGRKIRAKLSSFYRKTLNLVQVEQRWEVKHVSGDPSFNVKAETRERAEAVVRAHPAEYSGVKHVKVVVPVGPSLDSEVDSEDGDHPTSLHEAFGENAEQEWMSSIFERVLRLQAIKKSDDKRLQLETIVKMRQEGYTFVQIGARLGKSSNLVKKVCHRAQKRAA